MASYTGFFRRKNPRLLRSLTVAAPAVLLLGTGLAVLAPYAHGADPDDSFTVKPESIAFGKQALYTSRTENFWLKNKGSAPLRIESIELRGANEAMFKLDHNCKNSLAVGEECRVSVKFEPTTPGELAADLRVVAGDKSMRTKPVRGVGVLAQYTVVPKEIHFGSVGHNSGAKQQKVTITNTGSVPFPVTSTSLSGPNERQFSQSNDCGEMLGVGKSCSSTIEFRPTDQGVKTATLTVWAKGGATDQKVELQGTGT